MTLAQRLKWAEALGWAPGTRLVSDQSPEALRLVVVAVKPAKYMVVAIRDIPGAGGLIYLNPERLAALRVRQVDADAATPGVTDCPRAAWDGSATTGGSRRKVVLE